MTEKTDKELATELTIGWMNAISNLKTSGGQSTVPALSVAMAQKAYSSFLSTISRDE